MIAKKINELDLKVTVADCSGIIVVKGADAELEKLETFCRDNDIVADIDDMFLEKKLVIML